MGSKKPILIFSVFISLIVILGLGLLGCGGPTALGPQPPTEVGEVVEEARQVAGSEETLAVLETEQAAAVQTEQAAAVQTEQAVASGYEADWCNPDEDHYQMLANYEEWTEGIRVEICIPEMVDVYSIETYPADPGDLEYTKEFEHTIPVTSLLTYFRVMNGAEVITTFNPPLRLKFSYTAGAWNQAVENVAPLSLEGPLVAYLPGQEGSWSEPWVVFGEEVILIILPAAEDPDGEGFLYLEINELPDPLIGGC